MKKLLKTQSSRKKIYPSKQDVDEALDVAERITQALPKKVKGLDSSDAEFDDIVQKALESYEELMRPRYECARRTRR